MPALATHQWFLDPKNPRAPSSQIWDRMSEQERAYVVASLPSEFVPTLEFMPEGSVHYKAIARARSAAESHCAKSGRKVYIASNMAVYYPAADMFSPDVMAVLDAEDHERDSWIVSNEGRGIDLCIEMLWSGSRKKDYESNAKMYAAYGISEYFLCDLKAGLLFGYRLGRRSDRYTLLFPRAGRIWSKVLELDLAIEGTNLRFFDGPDPVPFSDEMITRLNRAVASAERHAEQEQHRAEQERQRAEQERQRAEQEQQRAEQEQQRAEQEQQRAEDLLRQLKVERERAEAERERAEAERERAEAQQERARSAEQQLAEALAAIDSLKREISSNRRRKA